MFMSDCVIEIDMARFTKKVQVTKEISIWKTNRHASRGKKKMFGAHQHASELLPLLSHLFGLTPII